MEFWERVIAELAAIERSQAWLARRVGRNPQTLNMYRKGRRPTPKGLRREIGLILGLKDEVAA